MSARAEQSADDSAAVAYESLSFADELAAAGSGAATLAKELRRDTKAVHDDVSHSQFIKRFIAGEVSRPLYARILATMHGVYSALEEELKALAEEKKNPLIAASYFPRLARASNIESDLRHLAGDDWRSTVQPLSSGEEYVSRIREAAMTQPELLIAHAYVRYLGDLSGGQMMKKTARRVLGREGDGRGTRGTDFFEFPEIADPRAFKNEYRAALDALPLSRGQRDAILREALAAYQLNRGILLEGDRILDAQKASGSPDGKEDGHALPAGHPPATSSGGGKCPFAIGAGARGSKAAGAGGASSSQCPAHLSYWTGRPFAATALALLVLLALAPLVRVAIEPLAGAGAGAWAAGGAGEGAGGLLSGDSQLPAGHPPVKADGGECPFNGKQAAPRRASTSDCPAHLSFWLQRPLLSAAAAVGLALFARAVHAAWPRPRPAPKPLNVQG
eukprot:tig00000361_g24357.t1